ncbi:hypothetical protein [uncultured Mediterranean phage uvDeep-CGR2-KM21-C338]|nr:hypothetical protein [uncultured Mediterranean phage uvDeep-CGR2-KM21-C338]
MLPSEYINRELFSQEDQTPSNMLVDLAWLYMRHYDVTIVEAKRMIRRDLRDYNPHPETARAIRGR